MKWNDVGSEQNSLFYKIGLNKEDLLFALGVDKQLADLEAKLAESEKDRLMWQEMYKSADKQNKEICETDIYPLQEQVQQLKQELKEKEKHIIGQNALLNKSKENNNQLKQQLAECEQEKLLNSYGMDKNADIAEDYKQQLAEKENLLKTYTQLNEDLAKRLDDRCDICIERYKQSQNQTAIAELEKLKHDIIYYDTDADFNNDVVAEFSHIVFKLIDQQIKSLKGEK